MSKTYIGIGGNIGNKEENIRTAINFISKDIAVPEKISNLYLSEPWGFKSEHNFLNCVISIKTNLSPEELLSKTINIENQMKRLRTTSNSYEDRTIDIDLLFIDNKIVDTEKIKIPHPKIQDRKFVLLPMNDIAPDFIHPLNNKTISDLLNECKDKTKISIFFS